MSRIVTLLLIGVLTLFSVPRAGMSHGMSGHENPGTVQETGPVSHPHEICPGCADGASGPMSLDIPCPHGAICALFTPGRSFDYAVSRALQPVGFPPMPAVKIIAREPSLHLPPPRIGFRFA